MTGGSYALDSVEAARRGLRVLETRFRGTREAAQASTLTYHDSFDWDLFGHGVRLSSRADGKNRALCWREADGGARRRVTTGELPAFAADLPRGALREALGARIGVRRLLAVVHVELRTEGLRILNEDRKTVARVVHERGHVRPADGQGKRRRLRGTLQVRAVRGYEKDAEQVARFVETELKLSAAEPCLLTRALAAIGAQPGWNPGRERPRLDPALEAGEAVLRILRRLRETMLLNEDGVRRDLDSEFLHDFRVAVRRTRSALGQLGQMLPAEKAAHFRREFKWLGALTGPTRDMDVYLLEMPRYRQALTQQARSDLDPLQRFLEQRQKAEHRRLVRGLDSKRYRKLVADWTAFLEHPAKESTAEAAGRPVVEIASERIRLAFDRVLERGKKIKSSSPARRLHRLRIECKKLRYLLEFFSDLYERKPMQVVIKHLKQLQDLLGAFNDLELQQENLRRFGEEMGRADLATPGALLAMGRLVEHLHKEQLAERKRFEKCFERFSSAANQRRLRRLGTDRVRT